MMLHRQKTPVFSSHFQTDKYTYEVSLEHQLIKLWMLNKVSQSYQALMLRYMDMLSGQQMEAELKKQIRKTYERQSFDFKIRAFLKERQQTLQILHNKLTLIEREGVVNHSRLDVSEICDLLDHLRKIGLIVTEEVHSMFKYFKYEPEKTQSTIGKHYWQMFKTFGEDIDFLQESVLIDYVPFSEQYDPLMIEPVRTIKKLYEAKAIYYNQNIEELFTVNVSYLYRLMRAHQVMLKYANLYYSTEEISPLMVSPKKNALTFEKEQPDENIVRGQMSIMRSNGVDYVPYRKKNQKSPDNNEREKDSISPITHTQRSKAHSFSIRPRQIEVIYGPKKVNKQQSTPNTLKKDKRSIFHCEPVVVFTYAKSKEKRCATPPTQKLNSQNCEMTKLVNTEIPRYKQKREQVVQSNSQEDCVDREDRSIREPTGLGKNSRKNIISKKAQKHQKPVSTSRTSPNEISYSSRLNPSKKQSKKNIRSIELPRLSRITSHSKCKQTVDCACRKKYKSRKRQKQFNDNSLSEFEERRKEIVKGIRLKHKHQAQKQINYELSLIGDRTYHQMKYKSYQKRAGNIKNSRLQTGE